ncbi:isoflavone reductase [Xylaria bambusicola]|uniref:isoflavone reductase n=1 Tax=Xylaria bambusicola TaxID=326684 RepID=UPI0020076D77|nr:isoflavone reductase [Xylaria bambusicola]KAI0505962.1 isoflavone reductase [Xylaria bambusicola]
MPKKSAFGMMRIAIAGAGGLAALITRELSRSAHAILVLSRVHHPEFEAEYEDCQVAIVDYNDPGSLQFALQGVDLVISTIAGVEQLNLIDAARQARVHTFVPSEFEGALSHRPPPDIDPFNNGSSGALDQLRHWSSSRHYPMKYTVFSCGIFYERFAPGGLRAYNMGGSCRLFHQGDYLVDIEMGTAELPQVNAQGRPIQITLTSAEDVARFVAAAVELGIDNWPREFKMRGARITPQRIVQYCSGVRQVEFNVINRPYSEVVDWLEYYRENNDEERWFQMQHVLQTANGRYTFNDTNLNELVDVVPMDFRQWLSSVWGPAQ